MAAHGPELVGRRFSSLDEYLISPTALESFADVVGAKPGTIPPTFLITFAVSAAEDFLPTLGFNWSRVVHGDQRFLHHEQIKPGERLRSTSEIESYKSLAGNEFVNIRTDFFEVLTNKKISSTWSTLVFRGEES